MQVEEPEDPLADLEPGEDPLDRLGYGMKSYFNLINYVTWVFFFLTIINWPIYSIFSSYDHYASSASAMYILGSMGNLGFASTECQITRIQAGETVLNCPTGVISEIVAYGVSLESENINNCNYNSTGTCNSVTSTSSAAQNKFNNCIGNETCFINNVQDIITGNSSTAATCKSDQGRLYVQYYCTQTDDELAEKRDIGALVSAITCFSNLFLLIMTLWMNRMTVLNKVDYDLDTLTAGDYSIDLRLSEKQRNYLAQDIANT